MNKIESQINRYAKQSRVEITCLFLYLFSFFISFFSPCQGPDLLAMRVEVMLNCMPSRSQGLINNLQPQAPRPRPAAPERYGSFHNENSAAGEMLIVRVLFSSAFSRIINIQGFFSGDSAKKKITNPGHTEEFWGAGNEHFKTGENRAF